MIQCVRRAAAMLAVGVLVACGGGGSTEASSTSDASSTQSSVVSGSVVKGPVSGATVCAYQLLPTGKGAQLGCTQTQSDGSYSLSLDFTGEIIVEAVGGTYTDEATGVANVQVSTPLSVAGSVGPGTQVMIATPLTSLALSQASAGGLTVASFDAASTQVGAAFGLPADLKLSQTLPVVTPGQTNQYGDALIGVSKMVQHGATLQGIIANTSLASLASGYALATNVNCAFVTIFSTSQALVQGVELSQQGAALPLPANDIVLCMPLTHSGSVQTLTSTVGPLTPTVETNVGLSNPSGGAGSTIVVGGTLVAGGGAITINGAGTGSSTTNVALSGSTNP